MIFSADVAGVIEMAEQILTQWLGADAQERHQVNSKHSALVGKRAHLLVTRVAWQIRQCTAAAMADGRRDFAHVDRLGHRALSGVAEVKQ